MSVDAFRYGGKRYDREGFRGLLRQQMQAARSDPKHPFNDSKHPNHAAAVADMNNAYRWLNGEVNEAEEYELAAATNEAIRGESEMAVPDADVERVKEMNRIAADREGGEALRRAVTGQDLDARQTAIVERYRALELAHNEQARHEQRSPGGTMKIHPRPALGADVMPWLTSPQRSNAANFQRIGKTER
jgi:hypothetical protein